MDQLIKTLWRLFNDNFIFPVFEIIFVLIFFYALMFKRSIARVKRGETSWNYFSIAYGILSVIMVELVSATESINGYKTIIILANLGMLLYLCYFSGWFRNKIIGFFINSKEKWE